MTDFKQNDEYVTSRKRGLLFGWLALLSFPMFVGSFILFMAILDLLKVDLHYGILYLGYGPLVAIGLAIYWLVKSQRYRKAALAIRFPDTYKVKLPKQFRG